MGLGRWLRAGLLGCLLSSLAAGQTSGEGATGPDASGKPTIGEAGAGHFGMQLGFYNNTDGPGDGNPFLDESLTVIEPVVVFDYNVTDRLTLGGILSYDFVSSASIDRLSKFPDQSGASGDNYIGADLSLLYQQNRDWTIGGHAGYSVEYDYNSIGLGLGATQQLRNADAKLSYNLDAYLDSIDVIRYNGVQEGTDNRTSVSGTVNWYQVLSPTSHGTFGLTVASQSGFLETPYNAVVVEDGSMPGGNPNLDNLANGVEDTELLPDSRLRGALFGRVRNSLGRGSAYELGGRLYSDSWGISSVTFEPRYYRTLVEDKLDWMMRYRFYTQTAADAFGDHFTTAFAPGEERTQDSDLAAFDAHTLGTKFIWYAGKEDTLNVGLDYTMRSDGLDQIFASVGWSWSF